MDWLEEQGGAAGAATQHACTPLWAPAVQLTGSPTMILSSSLSVKSAGALVSSVGRPTAESCVCSVLTSVRFSLLGTGAAGAVREEHKERKQEMKVRLADSYRATRSGR